MNYTKNISIVIPAKNEEAGLSVLLPTLKAFFPETEIIIVDDGSTDRTAAIAQQYEALVVQHPLSLGNGAAIKSGARVASGDIIIFMDADGQHQAEDIPRLIEMLNTGYHMVVGARSRNSQAGWHRASANGFYNLLASWMVGHKVADLTSGFRAVRADEFRKFLHLLPNGFSYPTTITMSFFRAGYPVGYIPIHAPKRIGKSHLRITRDGIRFLLIIFKIGTLYSPLKLFAPVAFIHFLLGLAYYAYTYSSYSRLSSMTIFMLTTSVIIFLIGLISEQITALMYKEDDKK